LVEYGASTMKSGSVYLCQSRVFAEAIHLDLQRQRLLRERYIVIIGNGNGDVPAAIYRRSQIR
jgi:hypothetical protein